MELYEVIGCNSVNPNRVASPGFESAGEWVLPSETTTTSTRYYYAGTTRLAMREGEGSGTEGLVWLLGDHLGSTNVVAEGDTGALLERYLYKPWGELRAGSLATGPLFTGQMWENEVGLYDYEARFYDSGLGRFISPDSLIPDPGDPLSWDRFAYVQGNIEITRIITRRTLGWACYGLGRL